MGMGPAFRSLRTDRTAAQQRLARGTVKRVLRYAAPHRLLIAYFLVLTVVDAGLVVVSPLLVQRIVDDGILAGNGGLVTELALLMAAVALFDAVLTVLVGYLSSRIGEGLIYDLRTAVFGHVQRQSLAFFTRTQTGALVSRLNNDVIGAQRAFTSTLSGTVSNSISVIVVGIAMMALSWQITLLCLLLFPLLYLCSRWVGNRLAGLTRDQMDGNADMGNAMTERFNVGGAMLLKLFGRRSEEDAVFATKAATVRDLGIRISLITRIFAAAMMAVPALATALVYGVGGQLAVSNTLTVGTLTALATLLLRLLGPLQGLSNVRIDVMTALVSFERVFEVLDLPSMIAEHPDAVALSRTAGRVEFDHVAFRYPRADEVSLASLETVARAESHDTILANLAYARPDATDEQVWSALDAAQIGSLVRTLPDGLDTVVGDRGYRLSGGERQRLAIARLLLKAPSIVVRDEATAHLDSESEVAVQRALDRALEGRTSLVIAHRLSTVRNADLILVVDDGRVVQSGTHEGLLAEGGLYADLYETQFAVRSA